MLYLFNFRISSKDNLAVKIQFVKDAHHKVSIAFDKLTARFLVNSFILGIPFGVAVADRLPRNVAKTLLTYISPTFISVASLIEAYRSYKRKITEHKRALKEYFDYAESTGISQEEAKALLHS